RSRRQPSRTVPIPTVHIGLCICTPPPGTRASVHTAYLRLAGTGGVPGQNPPNRLVPESAAVPRPTIGARRTEQQRTGIGQKRAKSRPISTRLRTLGGRC